MAARLSLHESGQRGTAPFFLAGFDRPADYRCGWAAAATGDSALEPASSMGTTSSCNWATRSFTGGGGGEGRAVWHGEPLLHPGTDGGTRRCCNQLRRYGRRTLFTLQALNQQMLNGFGD